MCPGLGGCRSVEEACSKSLEAALCELRLNGVLRRSLRSEPWKLPQVLDLTILTLLRNTARLTSSALLGEGVAHEEAHTGVADCGGPDDGDAGDESHAYGWASAAQERY